LDCSNGFFFAVFRVVANGIECLSSAYGELANNIVFMKK
jgi:hypothetical protein